MGVQSRLIYKRDLVENKPPVLKLMLDAMGIEKNKSPLVRQRRVGPGLQLRGKEGPGFSPTNHRRLKKKK